MFPKQMEEIYDKGQARHLGMSNRTEHFSSHKKHNWFENSFLKNIEK